MNSCCSSPFLWMYISMMALRLSAGNIFSRKAYKEQRAQRCFALLLSGCMDFENGE
ncbi:hypothetical protein SAMN04488128_10830 [Chitinophaga eiseniae]|uniref:Uncharacterized protein n=1 Tax=Chitinophaga eiseniae TaxID=634771 RepID=A0A1T4U268_9BACT|nr:hypothetical protein SAMN04488128_10830 [Chitinophaga eiseniae]